MTETRKLVPLGVLHQLNDYSANYPGPEAQAELIEIRPMPGTEVEIVGLQCLNEPYQVVLREVRVGDEFPWQDLQVIDVATLRGDPYFKIPLGTVTEDTPLELAVQALGNPSVRPYLNLTAWGYETVLDPERKKIAEAYAERRKGHVYIPEFLEWLYEIEAQGRSVREQPWRKHIERTLLDFLEGKDGPTEIPVPEPSAEEAVKQAVEGFANVKPGDRHQGGLGGDVGNGQGGSVRIVSPRSTTPFPVQPGRTNQIQEARERVRQRAKTVPPPTNTPKK